MPAPGDQHKSNRASTANPFEETIPHINIYTAQEIATLQHKLSQQLGPEYISTRAGPGNKKVAYLSAEKAINLANEIFGFNGWSSSIQNIQIDFVDENQQSGKVSIGLSVVVRVTLRDGTYHEDIGYGGIENCKGKIAAFEKAKKEGTTDALKRALRNFGNVLGNCIYDHDYIAKVSKVKAGPGKWDVNNLHRHPDFAQKDEEHSKTVSIKTPAGRASNIDVDESFDAADFDDNDFEDFGNPDEILMPSISSNVKSDGLKQAPIASTTPSRPPQIRQPQGANMSAPYQNRPSLPTNMSNEPAPRINAPNTALNNPQQTGMTDQQSSSASIVSQHFTAPQQEPLGPPAGGFYSAKAAASLNDKNIPTGPDAAKFNPHTESRSIRKTSGVDHSRSIALNRHTLKPEFIPPKDLVDPKADTSRRVGMPVQSVASPVSRGMGTSAYRPPTRHGSPSPALSNAPVGGVDRVLNATKRPPLEDVSNINHATTVVTMDGADAKRQKIGGTSSAGAASGVENQADNVGPIR